MPGEKACPTVQGSQARQPAGNNNGFNQLGSPICAGAISGTVSQVCAPSCLASEYLNPKRYSQSSCTPWWFTVDNLLTNTGWSGKVHDACIFRNTGLLKKLKAGSLFLNPPVDIEGVSGTLMIQGDTAHPLFPGKLDRCMERINYFLSSCKM